MRHLTLAGGHVPFIPFRKLIQLKMHYNIFMRRNRGAILFFKRPHPDHEDCVTLRPASAFTPARLSFLLLDDGSEPEPRPGSIRQNFCSSSDRRQWDQVLRSHAAFGGIFPFGEGVFVHLFPCYFSLTQYLLKDTITKGLSRPVLSKAVVTSHTWLWDAGDGVGPYRDAPEA